MFFNKRQTPLSHPFQFTAVMFSQTRKVRMRQIAAIPQQMNDVIIEKTVDLNAAEHLDRLWLSQLLQLKRAGSFVVVCHGNHLQLSLPGLPQDVLRRLGAVKTGRSMNMKIRFHKFSFPHTATCYNKDREKRDTMTEIYHRIRSKCPPDCRILVVSKHRSVRQIQAYYDLGVRDFGENRAQELLEKAPQLPADIRWSFIGHLQRNKVRAVLPWLSRIHSLDSLALAEVVEKEAARIEHTIEVLAEFNLAEEATKTGMSADEALPFFRQLSRFPHLIPRGIMVMGPHVQDEQAIAAVFHQARTLLEQLRQKTGLDLPVCSMGMSQDWPIALKEGSTELRLGSILFPD